MGETLRLPLASRSSGSMADRPGRQRLAGFVRSYARSRAGMIGLLLTGVVLGAAVLADVIAPYSPFRSAGPALAAPSPAYLMGTDDLGRDVFSSVIYGARTSLAVGLFVAVLAAVIGVLIGVSSAYLGGAMDDTLMRVTEFFQVVPRFFLAVMVLALFGAGLAKVILVLGLTSWTMLARILRAEVLLLRERDFIQAARSIGTRDRAIMLHHILPNIIPPLIVTTSLLVGQAILIEAGLSFLGLGDPNAVSWGYMLNNARSLMRVAWWTAVFPGLAITVAVLGINLSGDGLRDTLDPYLRI